MSGAAYAFFDVDDTLIRIKSMFSFFEYWCRKELEDLELLQEFETQFVDMRASNAPRTELNRAYYRFFSGVSSLTLNDAGQRWADKLIKPEVFFQSTVDRLEELRCSAVTPVFVSGSFSAILTPIAEELNVQHILATTMLVDADGRLTGEIGEPQTIGAGKARAISSFLSKMGTDPQVCWAFGDDPSDIPMLEAVGHPTAVGNNTALAKTANEKQWPMLKI